MVFRISGCVLALVLVISACGQKEDTNAKGKELAQTYCGSCHKLPQPSELDKQTWLMGVLPEMGLRLGIRSFQGFEYKSQSNAAVPPGFYPGTAVITEQEWSEIVNYFYMAAPDSLASIKEPISIGLKTFEIKTPEYPQPSPPVSSCVRIDAGHHAIYVAHGTELTLSSYTKDLKLADTKPTSTVVVDIAWSDPAHATVLNMGELNPRDVTHGSLQSLTIDPSLKLTLSTALLADSLPRPVNVQAADVDQDGKEDFVVCGYGNFTGSLFWLHNSGNGKYERRALRDLPGSIQAIVTDLTNDGRPDILALLAQGDEGIFLYEQQTDGTFSEKNIMRFSPVAGSISIDVADFNKDGFPDIVYTSGDNADYSKILKPYHGVYVYLNDGHWNLTQSYFFPINGCFKAVARDFDSDGDIDIAAISYFPDMVKRPQESFVYLENTGDLHFSAATFEGYTLGRWLTMDTGDYDGDGDIDIVLGNMSIGPSNQRVENNWRRGPAFVVLKNRTK